MSERRCGRGIRCSDDRHSSGREMSTSSRPALGSRFWFACRLAAELTYGEANLPPACAPENVEHLASMMGTPLMQRHARQHNRLIEAIAFDECQRLLSIGFLPRTLCKPQYAKEAKRYAVQRVEERLELLELQVLRRPSSDYAPMRGTTFSPQRRVRMDVIFGYHLLQGGTNRDATARHLNNGQRNGTEGLDGCNVRNAEDYFMRRLSRNLEDNTERGSRLAMRARITDQLWPRLSHYTKLINLENVVEKLLATGDLVRWHEDVFEQEPLTLPIGHELRPFFAKRMLKLQQELARAAA